MNNSHDEFNAEYQRQQIATEIRQIRLENAALKSALYRPGFFSRTMFNFANWMISAGKQLRKRYEIPAVNCNNTESFAH